MRKLGKESLSSNALWAYMTWSSFNFVHPQTGLHFYSNVDAGLVFNAPLQAAAVADGNGVCSGIAQNLPLSGFYDLVSKQTVIRIPTPWNSSTNTIAETPCPRQFPLSLTRKSFAEHSHTQVKLGYIEFGFDVRIAALVVGLNAGVLTLDSLVREENPISRKYGLVGYIDPFYSDPPQQYPIYCLDKSRALEVYGEQLTPEQMAPGSPEICFIVSAMKYANLFMFYPASIQVKFKTFPELRNGSSSKRDSADWQLQENSPTFNVLEECSCPRDQMDMFCSQTVVENAFFYDNWSNMKNTVKMAIKIQKDRLQNRALSSSYFLAKAVLYSRALFGKSWLEKIPLKSWTDSKGTFYDFSWSNGNSYSQLLADEFVKICDRKCGMFLFESYSYTARTSVNAPMNKYGLALREISPNQSVTVRYNTAALELPIQMCIDTFSQPEAMALLSKSPPVDLEEPYFECTNTVLGAITASAGNAFAISTIITALAWAILGALLMVLEKRRLAQEGTVLLTEETKQQLESVQTQMRSELVFEGFQQLSKFLQPSFVSKLERARCLFYDQGEHATEEGDGLLACGQEISLRLASRAESQEEGSSPTSSSSVSHHYLDGLESSDQSLPRRRTITLQLAASLDQKHSARSSFTREVESVVSTSSSKASSRLALHPTALALNSLQPPTRASITGGVRRSVTGAHQL